MVLPTTCPTFVSACRTASVLKQSLYMLICVEHLSKRVTGVLFDGTRPVSEVFWELFDLFARRGQSQHLQVSFDQEPILFNESEWASQTFMYHVKHSFPAQNKFDRNTSLDLFVDMKMTSANYCINDALNDYQVSHDDPQITQGLSTLLNNGNPTSKMHRKAQCSGNADCNCFIRRVVYKAQAGCLLLNIRFPPLIPPLVARRHIASAREFHSIVQRSIAHTHLLRRPVDVSQVRMLAVRLRNTVDPYFAPLINRVSELEQVNSVVLDSVIETLVMITDSYFLFESFARCAQVDDFIQSSLLTLCPAPVLTESQLHIATYMCVVLLNFAALLERENIVRHSLGTWRSA